MSFTVQWSISSTIRWSMAPWEHRRRELRTWPNRLPSTLTIVVGLHHVGRQRVGDEYILLVQVGVVVELNVPLVDALLVEGVRHP